VTFHCWEDFTYYREALFAACQRYECAIHAYVFMPNHVHLLMTSGDVRGPSHRLITPFALYEALGTRSAEREAAYRALFDDPLPQETLDTIRRATKTRGIVGDDHFRAVVEEKLKRSLARPPRGGDRRSPAYRVLTGGGESQAARSWDQTTLTPLIQA